MELVFVYGTLKQGQCRAGTLNRSRLDPARYLGIALTQPNYAIYNVGEFPALVEDELTVDRRVCGELYEVSPSTMEELDRIEGVPHLYRRGEVELDVIQLVYLPFSVEAHKQFEAKRATSYFFVDHERLIAEGNLIESGFWSDELKSSFID